MREVKCAVKKSTNDLLSLRVANWLMKQHTTASCTTGASPTSLMFGRELKTRLQLLHPDVSSQVASRMESQKLNYDCVRRPKRISISDRVLARSYGPGPAWRAGTVVDLMGDAMAGVRLDDGRVWRRHFDQLLPSPELSLSSESVTVPPPSPRDRTSVLPPGPPEPRPVVVPPPPPAPVSPPSDVPSSVTAAADTADVSAIPPSNLETVVPPVTSGDVKESTSLRRSTRVKKQTEFFRF